jgi:hypothetical protein
MLARAVGHRNYQSLRAQQAAQDLLTAEPVQPDPVDFSQVPKLARYFDAGGRLVRWPSKAGLRLPCLWVIWSKLPPRQTWNEDELNRLLRALHLFGDHALLRRELCDNELVRRTADGREYQRVERQPSPEGLALIRYVTALSAKGGRR